MMPCAGNCGGGVNPWHGSLLCDQCKYRALRTKDGTNPVGQSLYRQKVKAQGDLWLEALAGGHELYHGRHDATPATPAG